MKAATLFGEIGLVDQSNSNRSDVLDTPVKWRLQDGALLDFGTGNRNFELGQSHPEMTSRETHIVPRKLPSGAWPTRVRTKLAEEVRPRAKWLGHVTDILEGGFCATFQSDGSDTKAIVAEFDIEELSADDRPLLRQGAQLVWAVFTERRRGTQENGSVLYIRRIPPPSNAAIKEAENKLEQWFGHLTDESSCR